ncbi:hypothetical protein D043_0596A, partial [Vibrio parahaemolyticus EKP-021]
MNAHDRAG